jgi:arginine exporter protein ArgO
MATGHSKSNFLKEFSAALIRFIQKIPWLLPFFMVIGIGFTALYSWQAAQKCASEVEISMQFSLFHGVKMSSKAVFSSQAGKQGCTK